MHVRKLAKLDKTLYPQNTRSELRLSLDVVVQKGRISSQRLNLLLAVRPQHICHSLVEHRHFSVGVSAFGVSTPGAKQALHLHASPRSVFITYEGAILNRIQTLKSLKRKKPRNSM